MITSHTFNIVSVGKNKDSFIEEGILKYSANMEKFCKIKWFYCKESSHREVNMRIKEETQNLKRIITSLKPTAIVALEASPQYSTSEKLAMQLKKWMDQSSNLTFVIGGPFGFGSDIKNLSCYTLSLGGLIYNHQLVRVMLAEQLYRSLSIIFQTGYHH